MHYRLLHVDDSLLSSQMQTWSWWMDTEERNFGLARNGAHKSAGQSVLYQCPSPKEAGNEAFMQLKAGEQGRGHASRTRLSSDANFGSTRLTSYQLLFTVQHLEFFAHPFDLQQLWMNLKTRSKTVRGWSLHLRLSAPASVPQRWQLIKEWWWNLAAGNVCPCLLRNQTTQIHVKWHGD